MIIITGAGRSGTSFIAYLLMRLGFDLGCTEPKMEWISDPPFFGGGEDNCAVQINEKIHDFLVSSEPAPRRAMYERGLNLGCLEDAVVAVKEEILHFPHMIVKDPRFCITLETWILAGRAIDLIIDCQRDVFSCAKSMKRTKKHPGSLKEIVSSILVQRGYLEYVIQKHKVRRKIFNFPEMIDDPESLKILFTDEEFFSSISWKQVLMQYSKLADRKLIHYG